MSNGSGMARRSLGRQLKALREKSGKSLEDVRPVGSRNKIWRMETGKGPYKYADVRTLCFMYDANPEVTHQLTDLAAKTVGENIWEDYSDVMPSWFGTYVELEAAASRVATFEPDVVPGLLQTSEYARAVFRASRPVIADDVVERLVVSRWQRQQNVLGGTPGGRISVVLGEGALARKVGGAEVTERQIQHLRELCSGNQVNVRILTWESGAHAAMEGSFTLLEFADPDEPAVAYVDNRVGARYLEQPLQVQGYVEAFRSITEQSVPIEEYAP